LLADFGADVIKIEPPEGDPVRQMGQHVGDVSLYAASILRNKRSIALDLKTPQGRELAAELIERADILVENNRPGVMERLGLGYDALSARNPGLVMVRISGYGQSGPYAERPGYGAICEAVGGVRHMTGDPDRPPGPRGAGHHRLPVVGLRGLRCGHRHPRPHEDRAKARWWTWRCTKRPSPRWSRSCPPTRSWARCRCAKARTCRPWRPTALYPTRDGGWVLIAANSQPTWRRLVAVMQQPELLTDPRFETIQARGKPENMKAIDAIMAEWTRGFDAAPLEELLREGEVPTTRVYTIADIYADPHFRSRAMLPRCRTRCWATPRSPAWCRACRPRPVASATPALTWAPTRRPF
jgi:crotonobetainyl-CoA:carnitine CoA-transferase CaiB-like acyl-CoA transferase